ncbi:hypothetical protein BKA58DRAFT_215685 [Alternaria rosae]|uniref:uncharacterized protein n=1 Tax=Alternaria rosae TaxID=1187941 RepID=UPI001E8E9B53|nr:uncharacterized protein BKA58DRAFT_215685 [Alternaria rosae]KAH6866994.1 hypothetical protein BKA58DRAFT_215685 [Alternaria rosae]
MQPEYTILSSDSSSSGDDDDIIFVRSVEKPRASKGNNRPAKKRPNPKNVSAQAVSPSPATRKRNGGYQDTKRTKINNASAQAVTPSSTARKRSDGDQATPRVNSNNIFAQALSPSPAARKPVSIGQGPTHTEPYDFSTWAVSSSSAARAQIGNREALTIAAEINTTTRGSGQNDTSMLATRKVLEAALGKEALESQEKSLVEKQKRTDQYIARLEEAVKQKGGVNVSHNLIAQDHIAMLKARYETTEKIASTEIKILRESNKKLTEDKTKLTRSIKLVRDGHGAVEAMAQEDASAEIQILRENNEKLSDEKSQLLRSISVIQDETRMWKTKAKKKEAAGEDLEILRERNAKLTGENAELVRNVEQLKDEHSTLRANVSALTLDICEQKKLFASKKMRRSNGDVKVATTETKKLKNEIKRFKARNKWLTEQNTDFSGKLAELDTERRTTLDYQKAAKQSAEETSLARERIGKLQQQLAKLDQDFRERGEQLTELSRDAESKRKIKNQNKAAIKAKGLVQTRMVGMFTNYRNLFKKNKALLEKLNSTAEAGAAGQEGKTYRKQLKLLKGLPLKKLSEFKSQD